MAISLWVMGARGCVYEVHLTSKLSEAVTAEVWPVVTDYLFCYPVPSERGLSVCLDVVVGMWSISKKLE